jgi:hypothetical protein
MHAHFASVGMFSSSVLAFRIVVKSAIFRFGEKVRTYDLRWRTDSGRLESRDQVQFSWNESCTDANRRLSETCDGLSIFCCSNARIRNTGICKFLVAPGRIAYRPADARRWLLLRAHSGTFVYRSRSRFVVDPIEAIAIPSGVSCGDTLSSPPLALACRRVSVMS